MKTQMTLVAIVLTVFAFFSQIMASQNPDSGTVPIKEININPHFRAQADIMDKTPVKSTAAISSSDKDTELSFSVNFAKKEINKELEDINTALIPGHLLGEEIAKRLYLFNNLYIHESKSPAAISTRQIIEKPVIYKSINKIEKYYIKQVRKDQLTKDKAAKDFMNILEKALLLYYEDTKELEKILSTRDPVEKQIVLFNNILLY